MSEQDSKAALSLEIEAILAPAIDIKAPYAKFMVNKIVEAIFKLLKEDREK